MILSRVNLRPIVRALPLLALTGAASCATLAEIVLQRAVDEVAGGEARDSGARPPVDGPADPTRQQPAGPSGGSGASVYVDGPVPGWERSPRVSPSAATDAYFTARLFGGQCPTFNVSSAGLHDPFGAIERPPSKPFALDNDLGIDGHYVPFGHVRLGGPGTIGYQWEPLGMYGMAGGGCDFPGLPLLSFGQSRGSGAVLHR